MFYVNENKTCSFCKPPHVYTADRLCKSCIVNYCKQCDSFDISKCVECEKGYSLNSLYSCIPN